MEFKIKNSLRTFSRALRQEDGYPACQRNRPYFKLIKIPLLIYVRSFYFLQLYCLSLKHFQVRHIEGSQLNIRHYTHLPLATPFLLQSDIRFYHVVKYYI